MRAAMNSPSGLQAGELGRRKVSVEIWRVSLQASSPRSTTQMLSPPSRSEVNAIAVPSGENFGCMSHAGPEVIWRASPPSIGSR